MDIELVTRLTKTISSILSELPVGSVLRERVLFLKDQINILEKRVIDLEKRIIELEQENSQLKSKIAKYVVSDEFEKIEGLLWKRSASGTFEPRPYCPSCDKHLVMSQFPPGAQMHWTCSCGAVFDYVGPPGD